MVFQWILTTGSGRTAMTIRNLLKTMIAGIAALTIVSCGRIEASTMRLIRHEGTIHVENGAGKEIEVKEDMRFQSGSTLETEKLSLAAINLDDKKHVTVDELSRSEFISKNKKIELKLIEGNLFFNVTEPLEENEEFNIKTSTMLLGIRGTSGFVTAEESGCDKLIVTDGQVRVVGTNLVTGESKEALVNAGESVTVLLYNDRSENSIVLKQEKVTVEELPLLVLQMLSEDPDLMERVCSDTGWDSDLVVQRNEEPIDQQIDSTQNTEEPIVQKSESYLRAEALCAELAGLCNAGNYEDALNVFDSERFAIVKEELQVSGNDSMLFDTENGRIGIYKSNSDEGQICAYSGGFTGESRDGDGVWFSIYGNKKCICEGTWFNDAPNGAFVVRTYFKHNDSKYIYTGSIVNGLWDGTVVLKTQIINERTGRYEDARYSLPIKDGYYQNYLRTRDYNGELRYIIADDEIGHSYKKHFVVTEKEYHLRQGILGYIEP